MNARLDQEIAEELERLGPEERARALRYIRSLKPGVPGRSLPRFTGTIPPDGIERVRQAIGKIPSSIRADARSPQPLPPGGVPGRELLRFSGTVSEETLRRMEQVISEECERIDYADW